MLKVEALHRKALPLPISLAMWVTVAVLAGCALALTGLAGVIGAATLALLIVFGAFAAAFPASTLGVAICCLGLVPFNWGLQTGLIPKLNGDEALLLSYLAVLPFLYLFTRRSWQPGFAGLYVALAALVCTQALSLAAGTDLIAIRNFVESFVLGALLLVLFLQEGSNINPEDIGRFIVGVTVVVAALSVIERIVQINPIMEQENVGLYLSPELARITEGIYRPYVSFFHPSETGTFMALGVPFVVREWIQRKSWLSSLALLIVAAGLIVNATRGVWVAVLFAAVVGLRYAWLWLSSVLPLAALGTWIGYFTFKDSPFMQKIANPEDLYARFEYWKIAGRVFLQHPLIGVGYRRFRLVYLDYLQGISDSVHLSLKRVWVVDNMFLTTTVENGILGLAALGGFLLFAGLLLRRFRKALLRSGLVAQATFVRCSEVALIIYVVAGCFADVHFFTKATKYVFILVGLGLAEGVRSLDLINREKVVNHLS